jgi:regulator of RNase E activity RraA
LFRAETVNEEQGRFPGVTVQPGDYVVADVDGVVCVPRELVEKVKEVAAAGRAVDARCLEDINAGKGVASSFKKWRG